METNNTYYSVNNGAHDKQRLVSCSILGIRVMYETST